MAASTVVPLKKISQEKFIAYYTALQSLNNITRSEIRSLLEENDRQYQRVMDKTQENARAKAANYQGDVARFQNMTVPVVMPQVEAAVVYQSSVFLTGHPIFGVAASPKDIDAGIQLESVIEENSIRGGWARELMMFFRDGFKHNLSYIEVEWAKEVTYAVETDLEANLQQGVPKEVIWSGNKLKRLDPYNTFADTRVPPTEVHKKGEFTGYTEFMSRIQLKQLIAELDDVIIANIKPAFESGTASLAGANSSDSVGYYVPDINMDKHSGKDSLQGSMNWLSWASLADDSSDKKIDYKDGYEVTTLYCKVLPSEFELNTSKKNTPQIYKLKIVNHKWIIYCELQTNIHGYLPILCGQPYEDGLGYQTKSLAENAKPFQELATSYMTSIIASRRRAVTDRVLYDPSRIASSAINSSNSSAKIPVRPAAYGKNVGEAVYQFPYREDQAATSMNHISAILGLANGLAGQNQAQQGQFVKGNRTLSEFEDVMRNANGRDHLTSILLEHQVFTPVKHIIKTNILQYQGGTTLFNEEKDTEVEVDPIAMRKAIMQFKVSDGLTPKDKLLNADSFAVALQVLGSSPQISASYNVGQLFSYMMKTQGSKISEFEKSQEQLAYEQAVSSWQQLAMEAMQAGVAPDKLPPQPKPADYGYDVGGNKPSEESQDRVVSTQ